MDNATCATTSPLRRLNRRTRDSADAPFSAGARSGLVLAIAGASPNSSPTTIDTPMLNSSTSPFSFGATVSTVPRDCSTNAESESVNRNASSSPATPPATDSTRLSLNSCRTRRPRLAPIASRTAISLRRSAARESSRLAMLAHAVSSTMPTAAISSISVVRCSRLK